MVRPDSQSERRLPGQGESKIVEMRRLAACLGVEIARRPWPRRRLTDRELKLVERALADGCYELEGMAAAPRALTARVKVTRIAVPSENRYARARRLAFKAGAKLVGWVVGSMAFLAAAITIRPVVFEQAHRSIPLEGNLNVAVVPFRVQGRHTEAEQLAATALAHTVAISLKDELAGMDPIVTAEVHWNPEASAGGAGFAATSRAVSAFAGKANADAVIFGEVSEMGATATLAPYVYLSAHKLPRATEIAGVYPLGDPIPLPVALGESAPGDGLLRRTVADRGRGLAEFIDAIGYYSLDRFGGAIAHLGAAAGGPGWSGPEGRAMLDLFRGNATAKLAHGSASGLARAAAFYRSALAHDPGFTRARFGMAEVGFQRSHGECTRGSVDARGLAGALADYRSVLAASTQPPHSPERLELSAKARFGAGRVYLCQSQAELAARWVLAERELKAVIEAFAANRLLRDEAAEAWGDLAIVELPSRGQRNSRPAYMTARSSYTQAILLIRDPAAKAVLYANRAYVAWRLGERTSAIADYRMAVALGQEPAQRRHWQREAAVLSARHE